MSTRRESFAERRGDIIRTLQKKLEALAKKREDARKRQPPPPAVDPAPSAPEPSLDKAPADPKEPGDADAEAERLLREAEQDQSEIEALEKALEKAQQERYDAEKRVKGAGQALSGPASGSSRPA